MAGFDTVKLDTTISNVLCAGKNVDVCINETCIGWKHLTTDTKLKEKDHTVEWKDVVAIETKLLNKKSCVEDASKYLTLHYISKQKDHKWRCVHISFEGDFSSLIETIQQRSKEGKPKHLLCVINPIGGTGKARQTYEKTVAPLFALSSITVDVQVTERAGHAVEIGKAVDTSKYDGLVVVGGDGIYHEILNGLLLKTQEENNVDYNDVECQLSSPVIPIGVIPAGTGNGIAGWGCGVIDVETSALHIVRGEHHKSSVLDLNVGGKHVLYGGLLFAYGMMSDLIKKAESRRWMKVLRYPVTMISSFASKPRLFKGEVKYKTKDVKTDNVESEWKRLDQDEFISIGTFNGDMSLESEVMKLSLQQPTTNLMTYPPGVKRTDIMKFWFRLMTQKRTFTEFEWLTFKQQVTRYHIKVDRNDEGRSNYTQSDKDLELFVNVDGESIPITEPELELRFCPYVISLYLENFAF